MLATRSQWKRWHLFPVYYDVEWDSTRGDQEAYAALQKVDITKRRGVLLWGPPGTGKTLMAHLLLDQLVAARYINRPSLKFDVVRASEYMALVNREMTVVDLAKKDSPSAVGEWEEINQRLHSIRRCSWLLLDDLATEYESDWSRYQVTSLIRQRGDAGKPMILTTNLDEEQFGEAYGERTMSYIHQVCDVIEVAGEDHRRAAR